jgi:hypothetical protein
VPAGRWRSWRARAIPVLRHHWLASLLITVGLVLRVLAQIAYQPALVYVDTAKYLYGEYPGADPLGYRVVLKVVLVFANLATVAALQHLLGLAMAVALYVLLVRRGVNRWLAALAIAPVLLDAYELQMEQMIMPDVWFEAMIVAGLMLLLWKPDSTTRLLVAAGLVLGASASMRQIGEYLVVPAVLYLLAARDGWRKAITKSMILIVAFLVPIVGYCSVSYLRTHHFWLARGQSTIGRVAAAADCATLKLPADIRPFCPTPKEQANGPDWLEHASKSPLYATPVPPGKTHNEVFLELSSAIKHQQPMRVAAAALRDSVRLFALTRDQVKSVTPIGRWQFQLDYPQFPPWTVLDHGKILIGLQRNNFGAFRYIKISPSYGGSQVHVVHPLAVFLRDYQLRGGYTPGPLYALCFLLGLAGSLLALFWRRRAGPRTRQLALGCLLFTASAVIILLAPDVFEYSWRYELPATIVLPMAGALGVLALLSYRRDRKEHTGSTPATIGTAGGEKPTTGTAESAEPQPST